MRPPKTPLYILLTLLVLSTSGARATQPAAQPVATAGVDDALLAGLRWRSIGPARGGRLQ